MAYLAASFCVLFAALLFLACAQPRRPGKDPAPEREPLRLGGNSVRLLDCFLEMRLALLEERERRRLLEEQYQ